MLGISKRELLDDYYPDELPAVFEAWAALHGAREDGEEKQVGVMEFLNM